MKIAILYTRALDKLAEDDSNAGCLVVPLVFVALAAAMFVVGEIFLLVFGK
jgi:hypothetical protein